MLGFQGKLVRRSNSVRGKRKQRTRRPTTLERPRPRTTPPKLRKARFSTKIGTETKLGVRKRKMMSPLEIDTSLINYSRFLKTAPMDLKFDAKAKYNMENRKIKKTLEIDGHLINYS